MQCLPLADCKLIKSKLSSELSRNVNLTLVKLTKSTGVCALAKSAHNKVLDLRLVMFH